MHKLVLGTKLQLRKKHACGSFEWEVVRTGADVKIKCLGCDRIVMLDRPTLQKRIKKVLNPLD